MSLKEGDKVIANITRNGYWVGCYKGTVVGFTATGRVKVKSWRGVKCHAEHNCSLNN